MIAPAVFVNGRRAAKLAPHDHGHIFLQPSIMEVLHEGLGDPKYAPCPLLRQYVAAGRLGRKSHRGFYDYA